MMKMTKNEKGTKTIKLAIYFWTNVSGNEKQEGLELPKKTCWDSGFVSVVSNNIHGIKSGIYSNFNNFKEIPKAIEDALKRSEIIIIQGAKGKEYTEALKKIKEARLI